MQREMGLWGWTTVKARTRRHHVVKYSGSRYLLSDVTTSPGVGGDNRQIPFPKVSFHPEDGIANAKGSSSHVSLLTGNKGADVGCFRP